MTAAAALVGPTGDATADQIVETGSIAGQVVIVARSTRRLASPGAYPGRTITTAASAPVSELANVVVFVNTEAAPSAPMHEVIHQRDETFIPHTTVVTVGSTVDFPNDDIIFHDVLLVVAGCLLRPRALSAGPLQEPHVH